MFGGLAPQSEDLCLFIYLPFVLFIRDTPWLFCKKNVRDFRQKLTQMTIFFPLKLESAK